jgi:hypothetical protein
VQLRAWSPGIIHGLLQTEDYAAALLRTSPGASDETVASRLRARMERQRCVILRDIPPAACFVVDEMALYRVVGSPAVMAAQLRQLRAMAAMPDITIQVLPAIAHPANASGFVIADDTAWCEHVAGGFVYTAKPLGPCCACSIPFAQKATAPPRRQHCSKGRPRRGQLAQVHLLRRQRRRLRRSRFNRPHHGPRHQRP